ncbi:ADP-ribose pyrophosphatase YjhB (NUDIX family) [Promicromonospora sp. AC04]|nr:ADP-ribose pyrophosphatase YjhB (NUDIX family) [Promicromonospora sp. AC04]
MSGGAPPVTTSVARADGLGTASALGDDWVPAPDGVRERSAARVILVDDAGRVLVLRGHDVNQPERSWWFTVGGGIDAGETPVQAALRETREEVGIVLADGDLVGPVLTRTGIFDFFAETCRQHEVFYLARTPNAVEVTADGWTDAERELLDEVAWLTAAQLREQPLEVFPPELPDVVDHLLAGWDGQVRHLGVQMDD